MPFSYHSKRLGARVLFSWKVRHVSRFFGHISGTGSQRHGTFKLDLWPHFSFQTSPKLSKSVEPSPRKRCEFNGSQPKNHISGYISGTGSRRHNPFTLVQYLYSTFRMSTRLFNSVKPSPRKAAVIRLHLFNTPIVPFE